MTERAKRSLALLVLAAFWQAAAPSLLHQILAGEDDVHVWCPEHNRLEHLHAPEAAATRTAGKESGDSRFSLQRPLAAHHTPCPLFLAKSAAFAAPMPAEFSSLDPAAAIPRPAPLFAPSLLPICYAPKSSPPADR